MRQLLSILLLFGATVGTLYLIRSYDDERDLKAINDATKTRFGNITQNHAGICVLSHKLDRLRAQVESIRPCTCQSRPTCPKCPRGDMSFEEVDGLSEWMKQVEENIGMEATQE